MTTSLKKGRGCLLQTDFWWTMLPNFEEINNQLITEVKAHKNEENDPSKNSNLGCWRGHRDYPQWPTIAEHAITLLKEVHRHYINNQISCVALEQATMDDFEITYWTNVNDKGSSNTIHSHANCHWSGVYYIQGKDTGEIAFYTQPYLNKQIIRGLPFGQSYAMEPTDGLLLLFPSYLLHEVLANPSDKERINIAFNIKIKL